MTAPILHPLVLPADVVIAPVADLPSDLRGRFDHKADDYSVTRPRARSNSSIVDRKTATLLEAFRSPTTIVDAVLAYSRAEQLDPRETLDEAFTVLGGFVNEGLLVAADSELSEPIAGTLEPGDRVGEFEIAAPIHVLVDTEVYLGHAADGDPVALKIARLGSRAGLGAALHHEASILETLDGHVTPRLLELGELDGRPYLALSWCAGVDAVQAATEARALGGRGSAAELLALAEAVVAAYAHLHEQGVLHGDVHPRNVLVDARGEVTIIDFGLAVRSSGAAPGWRGGVDFFMEPELATARLNGGLAPAPSAAGEQYSVAALVYLLLTSGHTHAFSLEQDEMLRQLVEQPPLPFGEHGVRDLAATEGVLGRALAKDPGARHRSLRSLGDALRRAGAEDLERRRPARPHPGPEAPRRLLDEVLARLALNGELAHNLVAPTASAMNGGAGFAYALLRTAYVRGDESLLALADAWSTRAGLALGSPESFWNEELEITPDVFGERSFYHTAAGVHGVQALVAHARGDEWAQQVALDSFVAAAGGSCPRVDVAFGRSGLLLGCALMLEALPPALDAAPLRALGDRLRDSLWAELEGEPPLAEGPELRTLGAAHGWAGYLYALLRWSEAAGGAPPEGIGARLEQLRGLGHPAGRGLGWPHEIGAPLYDSALAASWCNGAAGFVHLWLAAERVLGRDDYRDWALRAAWTAQAAETAPGDLCCGFAGRAYALLAMHRQTGDERWLARARVLAEQAVSSVRVSTLRRDSLYKGEVGVALLAAELEDPEYACMPLFEGEGWTG